MHVSIMLLVLVASVSALPNIRKLRTRNVAVVQRGADCADTGDADDCKWWNEQEYCTHKDYKFQMKELCAATCGCEAEEVAVEEQEVVVQKRECENKSPQQDCDWWFDQNYCTDTELGPAMLEACPCSCEGEGKLETVLAKRTHDLLKVSKKHELPIVKRCEDSASYCAVLLNQGACAADSFGEFGKKVRGELCQMTCGSC